MKKRANQTWLSPDLGGRTADGGFQLSDGVRAEVSQLAILQVIPKPLVGIQVRGIGRKKFYVQPPSGIGKKLLHRAGAMNQGTIPKENDPMPEVPFKVPEEFQNLFGPNAAIDQHQKQTSPPADGRNRRKFGPGGAMPQDRCLAPGCPGTDTGGMQ